MSDDSPFATTPEDQRQLGEYIRTALLQCLEELGFAVPLTVACVATNGSVLVVRTDGEDVEQLAYHTEGRGFALPLNIMITDSRGEATRMLVTNEGMRRLN